MTDDAKDKTSKSASRILRDPNVSDEVKSVAALALTQTKSPRESISKKIAAAAWKILHDPKATKEQKSIAVSALTQKVRD